MTENQTILTRHFSKEELIELCHSRIPGMRHIVGFMDSGLIAPLPIWSPVPEKYRRSARDAFHNWGLEAQPIRWLPAELQKFAFYVKRHGRIVGIGLRKGACKERGVK